jgi:hypothetical protein
VVPNVPLTELEVCCDVEHHVFNPAHTQPAVAAALRGSHWFELDEWAQRARGSGAG